jgi:glycosyltransferase involved in cell wall biosynthesis
MNKTSIIVPCYNHGEFIEEAVDSALQQSYQNIEIIIVDDASTEKNVREKINAILEKDSRIKSILLDENSGPSVARNRGIEAAEGLYILPLDADDRIDPTYVEKAVSVIESNPDIGVVYCEVDFFGTAQGKWELPQYSFPEILFSNMVFSTALYRKSDWTRYGGYNKNMRDGLEDWDFWLKFTTEQKTFIRIPETLFFYRQRVKSLTRNGIIDVEKNIQLLSTIFLNHRDLYCKNINYFFERWLKKTHPINSQVQTLFKRKIGRYSFSIQKKIKKQK